MCYLHKNKEILGFMRKNNAKYLANKDIIINFASN